MRAIITNSFVLLLLLLTNISYLKAQFQEEARLEIPIPKRTDILFEVLPLQKNVIVFGDKRDNSKNTRNLFFQRYDSTLKITWEKEFPMETIWEYHSYYTDSTDICMLFTKIYKKEVAIVVASITGEIEIKKGILPFFIEISSFEVFGKNAFLIGKAKGREAVLDFSFFDNSIKVVPSFYDQKWEIEDYTASHTENHTEFLLKPTKRKDLNFYLKAFQSNGKMLWENTIRFDLKKYGTTAKHLFVNNQTYILGFYGFKKYSNYPQGFWLSKQNTRKTEWLRYYSFDDVKAFFSYYDKEAKRKRMREKVIEKRQKGNPYEYESRFLLQKPFVWNNQIIAVAEGYDIGYEPNSRLNTPPDLRYPMYINTVRQQNMTYTFTNSLVCGFSTDGKLLWNAAMSIKNQKNKALQPHTKVILQPQNIIILSLAEKDMSMRVVQKDSILYENDEVSYQKKYEIEPQKANFVSSSGNDAAQWYDNKILIWGIYDITPKNIFERTDVFYIAKTFFVKPPEKEKKK